MSRFYNSCLSHIRKKLGKREKNYVVGKTVLHIPLEVGDKDEIMSLIIGGLGLDDL